MSSSDVRDRTSWKPSSVISKPAIPASTMEWNSRYASRIRIRIISVPAIAAGSRQPTSLLPKAFSPRAISHLPSGGCTTYAGPLVFSSHSTP
jgi:hypothetical protein